MEPLLNPNSLNSTTNVLLVESKHVKPDSTSNDAHRFSAIQSAHFNRNILLVFNFIVCTGSQLFLGIKMINFHFSHELLPLQASILGLVIAGVNAEHWLMKELVMDGTKEKGYLFKELHPHRLFYDNKTAGHLCDLCRARIREAYRCQQCDFDLCKPCFLRKNKTRGEGQLRGEKGIKEEVEVSSWGYLLRALALSKRHWLVISVAVVCLILSTVTSIILPNFQGDILDAVVDMDHAKFTSLIKFYIYASIATGFFGAIRSFCFSVVGAHMANDVRNRLFSAIIVQDVAFFDGQTTGELTSRLTNDASAMVSPMQMLLSSFLSSFLTLVGALVMCFVTSWRLAVFAMTSIGPIVQIIRVYAEWSRFINKEIWASLGDASSVATQAIGNIRTVRAFGCEETETGKYLRATTQALGKSLLDAAASAGTYALTNYLDLGTSVLILWYGGKLAMDPNLQDNNLTVGRLITFQLYWNLINSSYNGLINILTSFTRAAGAAQRVISLMDNLPDIDPTCGTLVTEVRGEIKLEDVSFHYQMRPDNKVLKGLSLTVEPGTTCALVGKSGGGKSTLVHLLMRFYDPSSGRILLDGVPLTELNLRSLHQKMALVAQDTQLFAASIRENIVYGLEDVNDEQVFEAARLANAHEFILGFEDGYDTRCGERGVRLSGGQKQRIAIARAMLRKAPLLFLDEATSALDSESEAQVYECA
jgi:ABC-type multidrug transport system fused ATPase/permease subunit